MGLEQVIVNLELLLAIIPARDRVETKPNL
jgi:hypothetical protein